MLKNTVFHIFLQEIYLDIISRIIQNLDLRLKNIWIRDSLFRMNSLAIRLYKKMVTDTGKETNV